MTKQLAAFVESIRKSGLLDPESAGQITAWAEAAEADPQIIAREIVQRGWLSAFQIKMFWKGRGTELILNQYVLVEPLGEGGMGEVYKAHHRRIERNVALKVIRKEKLNSPEAVKRFHQEIKAAAQLSHENVVMAYDADQAGDRHFFAMEFVEGTNLSKLVKDKGPLILTQACDCVRQAALGLQHAFERGMVHRDIKPSNLLLGKSGVVKILDMGLARLQEPPSGTEQSRITQEGLVIGTPDFLTPEQAHNARTVDIRADIYALGCTFYYLLCGHAPYQGGTPTERMLRHSTDAIPALTRPDVPPAVEAAIQRMMAKRPEDRFQLPAEIAFALHAFSGNIPMSSGLRARPVLPAQLLAQTPPSPKEPRTESHFRLPPPQTTKPLAPERTRWNLLIALAATVVVLGVAATIAYLLFPKNANDGSPGLDREIRNRHEMVLTLIQAGSFEMGSAPGEPGRAEDEGPVHTVEIRNPFYLGTTEVTLKQFKSVLGRWPSFYKTEPEDPQLPAQVSYTEARQFCIKLNTESSDRKAGWEYRLPTEAEWEYACRAGTKSPYSFGDSLSREQASFGDVTAKNAGRPAQFPANSWGLYDMHGHAAEWVADQYDEGYYAKSLREDPKGAKERAKYVIRGGNFAEPAEACRCARRRAEYPEKSYPGVGFRVALAQAAKP